MAAAPGARRWPRLPPAPGVISYGATKHAVVGLTKGLRIEGASLGIRVSALCPGFIRTPILGGGKFGRIPDGVSREAHLGRVERARPMDPAVFAAKAIDAVARNEALVVLPRWWRLVWWAHRVAPMATLHGLDWLYRREKRGLGLS